MLADYYDSIPKRRKIFYIVLIITGFFALLTQPVSSGNFVSWAFSKATATICDEIFESISQAISLGLDATLGWLGKAATKPFGISITEFTSRTNIGTTNAEAILRGFSISAGLFVSTMIFGFSMLSYFLNKKITDSKDTPISLIGKYIIAVIICYIHKDIVTTFLSLMDGLYSAYIEKILSTPSGTIDFTTLISNVTSTTDEKVTLNVLGITTTIMNFPGAALFVIIFQVFLLWKLLKAFIQMYLEMAARYITSFVFLCLFSIFGATIVSNETNQVFKSYLRTLVSSFFMLMFNIVWFKLCFFIAIKKNTSVMNLLQYIFLLEMLHLGVKMDSMLRSMGLGVATGSSRIATAVGSAGRNLANALRSADSMRKAAGGVMKASGIASNNKAMYDAGSSLGVTPKDLMNGKNVTDPENFASDMAKAGKQVNNSDIIGSDAATMINNAISSPSNRNASIALDALSHEKLAEGAQSLLGENSGIKVHDAKMVSERGTDGRFHTGIEITGTNEDGTAVTGVIGNRNAYGNGFDVGNGNVLNIPNSMSDGDVCSLKEAPYMAGTEAGKALSDAAENGYAFKEGSMLEKDGRVGNKDVFNVLTPNGEVDGTIVGDEFTMSAQNLSDAQRQEAFSNMRNEIMGGVERNGEWGNYDSDGNFSVGDGTRYDSISDFEKVKGMNDTYAATATSDDGSTTRFTATDKGINGHSHLNQSDESFKYMDTNGMGTFAYDVNKGERRARQSRGNEAQNQKFGSYADSSKSNSKGSYKNNNEFGSNESRNITEPKYKNQEKSLRNKGNSKADNSSFASRYGNDTKE